MKTVFVILTWQERYAKDIALAANESGLASVFPSHKEAEKYAEENLNSNWMIVKIEV